MSEIGGVGVEGQRREKKRIHVDKGKRQEVLIIETELLPETGNEQVSEDEMKDKKRQRWIESERQRGLTVWEKI